MTVAEGQVMLGLLKPDLKFSKIDLLSHKFAYFWKLFGWQIWTQ